jgi:two-component system sensor histidine kinase PilS (NtrC family)
MAEIKFNDRAWLAWLVRVRVMIIIILFVVELLIIRLTPNAVSANLFITIAVGWCAVSFFFIVLHSLWHEYKLQALIQIFTDLAFTTAVVYVTGGIDTFFNFLFPLVIIVASILLPRYWAFLTAAISFILFGSLLELTYFDKIPSFQMSARGDLKSLQAVVLTNFFAYMIVAYLASTLAAKLRQAGLELEGKSGELINLQALHENVIHSIRGGLITTDLQGRITLLNSAGEGLLQRTASSVDGRHISELFLDRLPSLESSSMQGEVRGLTLSGEEKTFGITVTALSVPGHGTTGFVYTFEDLTVIRRLEREIRMRDRLSAVGRLAAGIAHEIRNPLASIAGSVNMLSRMVPFNDEQRVLIDIVIRESTRLNAIITDFLAYSREKSFKFTRMDLVPLLQETLMLLENRPESREVRIVRQFESPSAFAVVDADRIKQVFWNLLTNAAQAAGPQGTIMVFVRPFGDSWQIGICDNGPGIPQQFIDKIFEPFQSQFEGGTGLGLAIVYQLIQAHGARISAKSEPGGGAEFIIEILHAKAANEAAVPVTAGAEVGHG